MLPIVREGRLLKIANEVSSKNIVSGEVSKHASINMSKQLK